jgi:ribosomal protein L11 methylase PrmA
MLIASGILEEQASDVRSALEESGFRIERTLQIDDWAALVARR